jgi:hypothetical protein
MKVYSYNWATGEYIGETEADFSPLEPGEWLIPAYATPKVPPDMNEFPGKIPVFDREKNDWVIEDKPPEPKPPMDEAIRRIPDSLFGELMMGELFNGNG